MAGSSTRGVEGDLPQMPHPGSAIITLFSMNNGYTVFKTVVGETNLKLDLLGLNMRAFLIALSYQSACFAMYTKIG